MKLFDTHTHIFKEYYSKEKQTLIFKKAKEAGFKHLMMPACTPKECIEVLEYKSDFIKIAFGIHPSEAKNINVLDFAKNLDLTKYDAIGEIGLDTHWENNPPIEIQEKIFKKQLDLALKFSLPVIIHCRHEIERTIKIITEKKYEKIVFIFHSFTEGPKEAKQILEKTNAFISFNGTITFKNAQQIREALKIVPLKRILAETDAPFLSPVPLRGKTNEPINMIYTIKKIAEIKEIELEKLSEIIFKNSLRAFNL